MAIDSSLDLSLDRTSTSDQVAQRLRELIWAAELPPKARLREIPLAKAFGVSRPTMREALRHLEIEGLVRHEMHHGALVASLSREDIVDLYRIRRMLELAAVRRPPPRPDALPALGEAVDAMEQALADGEHRLLVEHDCRFHAAIVGLLESPRLDRFFAQISAEVRLALGILSLQDERDLEASTDSAEAAQRGRDAEEQEEVVAEHRRIYERIAAGHDVQHILEAHLDRAERRLLAILSARSGSAEGGVDADA